MPIQRAQDDSLPLFRHDEVAREFERWVRKVPEDPYAGSETVGIHDVLRAHFLVIDFFQDEGEPVGGIGPKDLNLLHSALSRQFVGFGPVQKWTDKFDRAVTVKVCQVGFPGWSTEVGVGAMKTIQRECRLDARHGIDSQTFFKGVEPMHSLIAEYNEALRRLADR